MRSSTSCSTARTRGLRKSLSALNRLLISASAGRNLTTVMVVVSFGAVVVANHRTTMTALNLAQASELLLNITHTSRCRHAPRLDDVSRPHHETLIRCQSNTSAIPPIPTANKDRSRGLLCASCRLMHCSKVRILVAQMLRIGFALRELSADPFQRVVSLQ